MKIIFLESPTKQKTFSFILENHFKEKFVIFATVGHLEKLKDTNLYNIGVDFSLNYKPIFEIIEEKKKMIINWKKYLTDNSSKIEKIYLATDSDREGERISKSIKDCLSLHNFDYSRLLINEITPAGIINALNNSKDINYNLIEAQISRQVVDKMIGYCLSPIVRNKLKASSVGRIQSFVLKLIVDRHLLLKKKKNDLKYFVCFDLKLNDKKIISFININEKNELILHESVEEANKFHSTFGKELKYFSFEKKNKKIFPNPPLTTSLLLSEAKKKLKFSISQTTKIAQKLYEGLNIIDKNKKKRVGLISYPRTDSVRINEDFSKKTYKFIENELGGEYCNYYPIWKKNKNTNVQDAHEAIRPTYLDFFPEKISKFLSKEEFLLYEFIFFHTIESFMSNVDFVEKNNIFVDCFGNRFLVKEKVLDFSGFFSFDKEKKMKYYNIFSDYINFDVLKVVNVEKFHVKEYLGNKIYPYNEGEIVSSLEKLGIGRPSTYRMFSDILLRRGYVFMEKGRFFPTKLGENLSFWINDNFSSIINEKYTSILEKKLDDISSGNGSYYDFIDNFWKEFSSKIANLDLQKK